jgi:hypothetical protein
MKRLLILFAHEVKLTRASIPIHVVAIVEPLVMYLLLTVILVHPTQDMYVARSEMPEARALVQAMREIGSPIGLPYVNPIIVDEPREARQVISVETVEGVPTAVQRYSLIDDNLVKNYRNRLTASILRLWDAALGPRAVVVEQRPAMERDIPYNSYFGMAMLPLAVILAAAMIGGVLTAQEFERRTIGESRLSPVSPAWTLAARLTRLSITALLAATLLLPAIGIVTGIWPDSLLLVCAVLLPLAVMAGCLGILFGLAFRATLPTFLAALVTTFVAWIVGDAFKPAAAVGGWYERLSMLTPNHYAVHALFPRFYGGGLGSISTGAGILSLVLAAAAFTAATVLVYNRRLAAEE